MATKTWQDGNDNWTTAADWASPGQPGSGDDVTVAQGDPRITSNVGTINSLTNSAEVDLSAGGALSVATTVLNSGTLSVDGPYLGSGGSSLTVVGVLTNAVGGTAGTLDVGNGGLTTPTTVTLGGLTNFAGTTTGTINVVGTTSALAALDINGAAGFGTASNLIGNVYLSQQAQIQFNSGLITTIRGNLTLIGAGSSILDAGQGANSALKGLNSVLGSITLESGNVVTTTGALANTGTVSVDGPYAGYGGSSLTVAGTFTNAGSTGGGTLDVGNGGISSASTVTVGGLSNASGSITGTINVAGSGASAALLDVQAAAGFGTAGILYGNVTLSGNAQIRFTGGQITTNRGNLLLVGSNASILDAGQGANSALKGLATNIGAVTLQAGNAISTTGPLANTGTLSIDGPYAGYGGSKLTVAGVLTNAGSSGGGTLDVGNGGITTNSLVSVTGITNVVGGNYGTINVQGTPTSSATGASVQGLLDVGGAAGFGTAGVLSGSVNLADDGEIHFMSGQITTIAASSELTLNGADAAISNDGTDANTALAGLTTTAGNLSLFRGASIATSGGLTNTAAITVDGPYGGPGGSSLTVGGTFTNAGSAGGGTLYVGNTGLTTQTIVSLGAINNAVGTSYGTIDVAGTLPASGTGATTAGILDVASTAGFGTAGVLSGNVNVQDDGEIHFNGGQITTIAAGGELSLDGANAAISNDGSDTNNALTGLNSIVGRLYLYNSAALATGAASATAGTVTIGNALVDAGYIQAPALDIAAGGSLEIASGGSVSGSTAITFEGTTSGLATLTLDATPNSGSTFQNALADFGANDALDLTGLTYAQGATASYANGTLTVSSNGVSENFTLTSPTATNYRAAQDSSGGTLVTVACYASGTGIRAVRDGTVVDVPVERLAIGDLIVTAAGAHRRIRWLGHRTIDCTRHPEPRRAHPIRIAAHAFGAARPVRDLYVSPGHAICVDLCGEILVPAEALVNGATITQVEVARIEYWHVELDSHDILLAENLPAESYIEMSNRGFFVESALTTLAAPCPDAGRRATTAVHLPPRSAGLPAQAAHAGARDKARAFG